MYAVGLFVRLRGSVSPSHPETLHTPPQYIAAHLEPRRCLHGVSPTLPKRTLDNSPLDQFHRFPKRRMVCEFGNRIERTIKKTGIARQGMTRVFETKMLGVDNIPPIYPCYRSLDSVLELPHIPGPRMTGEYLLAFSTNIHVTSTREHGYEVPRERQYILPTLSERRDVQGDHVQTIKEVFQKVPIFHHLTQVAIRRRHRPEVGVYFSSPSHPGERLSVKYPQEFRLRSERELTYLVEEHGALMCLLKKPVMPSYCSRESSALVPEERALRQRFWDRRTIHHHPTSLLATT
jgi:hypothetical protein